MIIMIITNIHIAITSQVIDNEANLATLLPPYVTQPVSHCPPQSRIIDRPSCQTRSVFPFCPRPSAFCLRSDSDDTAEGVYELCVFAFEKMWPMESNVWSLVNVADVCHFTKHVAFSDTDRRS